MDYNENMKTVYLLYEGYITKIPVPDLYFNKNLRNIFTVKGGVWNQGTREYFFNRKPNADKLKSLLPNTPIVQVDTINYPAPYVTFFFEMKWVDKPVKIQPVYFTEDLPGFSLYRL